MAAVIIRCPFSFSARSGISQNATNVACCWEETELTDDRLRAELHEPTSDTSPKQKTAKTKILFMYKPIIRHVPSCECASGQSALPLYVRRSCASPNANPLISAAMPPFYLVFGVVS